jgi:UDP-N-acetylglucosamine:LPS N-acetylglucosamine transferase
VPWWFDFQYRLFMSFAPTRWLALRLLTGLGRRGLMRLIRSHNPDVIVSTYPGVTAVLGELRRTGRLKVPVYSSITDLAGMHFWAHPGVDLHFVTHPETIEEVESIAGPGSVRWAKPPTSPAFLAARSRADARRALGLPGDETKVIAVSGGGWGVGDLLGATRAGLQVPDAIVLCLCGRNDKLRTRVTRELGSEPRLRVMGFTDRMGDVLAASDALVHSSAGLTVLEAIIRGCPVISYGFGYGHVRVSNEALVRFGLAQVAPKVSDIGPALDRALEHRPEPNGSFARRPSTASLILSDERRSVPLPAWRVRTARWSLTGAAAIAIASWTLTTGASYSLVSHFVHMRPVTDVSTTRPEVGVLIDAPASEIPTIANELANRGIRASFTMEQAGYQQEPLVAAYGDQAVPRLPNGGLVRWLGARDQLHDLMAQLGYGHHFLYASSGPSVGQWWMAHGAGGRLVAGAIRLKDKDDRIGHLRAGEVVELSVTKASQLTMMLGRLDHGLVTFHLRAVPVAQLIRDAGSSV